MGDFEARHLVESFAPFWQQFCNLMRSNEMKNHFSYEDITSKASSVVMQSRAFSARVENHLPPSPSVSIERKQLTGAWMCQSEAGSSNLDFLRSRIKLLA